MIMKLHALTLVLFSWLSRVVPFRLPSYTTHNQQRFGSQAVKPTIRNATLADVDAITDIIVDAFAPATEQQYIFQFLDKYRQYHWQCQRQEVADIIDVASENDGLYINVIDAPVGNGSDEMRAVALAGWVLKTHDRSTTVQPRLYKPGRLPWPGPMSSVSLAGSERAKNCHLHLDMNLTRALQWQFEFNPYEEHYIEQPYERQVYLALLATHPDYDGRGFGAAHCEWGKKLARQWEKDLSRETGEVEKVNVTLMATPRGYELYSTIGFESIANLTFTRVEGDEPKELTWQQVMVFQGEE